jgi:ERCC4-type nuclease
VEAQQNNSAGPHHEEYSSLIKVNKSSNVTPEVCQIVMLTQIPGVSHNFSKKILQEYGNIEKLIYALKSHEKPEMLLADIKVTDKRKLGKVLSNRIFNYLIIIDSE